MKRVQIFCILQDVSIQEANSWKVALRGSLNNWADKTSQWFRKNDNRGNGGVVVGKWGMGRPIKMWTQDSRDTLGVKIHMIWHWQKIRHICEDWCFILPKICYMMMIATHRKQGKIIFYLKYFQFNPSGLKFWNVVCCYF